MVAKAENPPDFPDPPRGFRMVRGPGGMVWVFREGASLVEDIDLWNGWIRGNGARKLAEPGGRAPVYHIEDRGIGGMVLRGFHHGGLFAKLMGNRFLGASRFLAELRVSEAIRREAVPTPEVLALHFRRAGAGTYRGWILTRYIGGGENLRRWVEAGLPGNPERRMVLRLAARTVGSLHAAGCLHPDLNLSNLLLAHGKIFVLDLDGASVKRPLGVGARCSNLLRLYRSLAKAMDRVEPLSLEDRWAFIKAYSGGDRDDSRALWRHLSSRWSLARARSHLSRGLRHVMHQESPGPPTGDGRR